MDTIIPIPKNLFLKESNSENLNFLLRYPKAYVMDNHLAAGWGWLQELNPQKTYCLFHIDQHEDLCNGGDYSLYRHLRENPHVSIKDYTGLEFMSDHIKYKVFRWDTYIKQVQRLFPNWFAKCYFSCPNIVRDNSTNMSLNICYNPTPFELYENIDYWVRQEQCDFIFNLDLDYFFNKGMRIFSDDYIKSFAQDLNKAMDKIAVLTIALSPECCGGWGNSIGVFNLLAEELNVIDQNPFA